MPSNSSEYTIEAMELGPMENFIYLLVNEPSKTAAVVDPAWDVPTIISRAKQLGVSITDVLLTHSHHDHINGLDQLLSRYDAQVHLLKSEAEFWGAELVKPSLHHGGDHIKLGNTEIDILHTPGHTPGSACYRVGDDLITGDTLFVFGCGRCDLHGGDPEQMHTTLKRFRDELPASIVIHPGHHYAVQKTSTLGEELEGNPFMHFTEVDKFVRYRMKIHDQVRNSPYSAVKKESLKSLGI
ncbi:MAG: MBL fold metallo-hydrolase [Gammaproteobacteria bacterium]|nr:MBL fold metallo-hydrolase [Gammaproteobacteria bacterium]